MSDIEPEGGWLVGELQQIAVKATQQNLRQPVQSTVSLQGGKGLFHISERADGRMVLKMSDRFTGVTAYVDPQELEDIITMLTFYSQGLHRGEQ